MITAVRYHDFSYGHRVLGHEGKCAHLHGHNGRAHFVCTAQKLDEIGRVIDFSVIKSTLCDWLEENWDHRFLIYKDDPWMGPLLDLDRKLVVVPFIPTAENMADYLLRDVGPAVLPDNIQLIAVNLEETRKCSAGASW